MTMAVEISQNGNAATGSAVAQNGDAARLPMSELNRRRNPHLPAAIT